MFLSREIYIKLHLIYKKIHIYTNLYRFGRFIGDHIQQNAKKSENEDIPEKPNCFLGFLQLLLILFKILFLFLIGLIDNIIKSV